MSAQNSPRNVRSGPVASTSCCPVLGLLLVLETSGDSLTCATKMAEVSIIPREMGEKHGDGEM